MLSKEFHPVQLAQIQIPENRHRKNFRSSDLDALADSIKRVGLIHPLVVTRDLQLVAGERRLQALKKLGWTEAPCQFIYELTPAELKVIELEENIKRIDLTWLEEARAVDDYYHFRLAEDPTFTLDRCAEAIGLSKSPISRRLEVVEAIRGGNFELEKCDTLSAAFNILERRRDRAVNEDVARLISALPTDHTVDAETLEHELESDVRHPTSSADAPPWKRTQAHVPVIARDFLEVAKTYRGHKFNFLHCDFPYGIYQNESEQGGANAWEGVKYVDTPEVYFKLLRALIMHHGQLLQPDAHILFWLSMKYYSETVEEFDAGGFTVNPTPLIWYKSDLRGILPDPQRGPRQVYEAALLITKGDRKIVKAVPNVVAYPLEKSKAQHLSEKPAGMLEKFFSMLVDKSTSMLDPTCGSGSALVAAIRCNAGRVLGMDVSEECVEISTQQANTAFIGQIGQGRE